MSMQRAGAIGGIWLVLTLFIGCQHPTTPTTDPQPPTPSSIWTTKTSMPTARYGAVAALIGSKIYVMGGTADGITYLANVEVYDTIADSWTSLGSTDPMPVGLFQAAAVAYGGKIYVFGGFSGAAVIKTIYCFDPSASDGNRWTLLAPTLSSNRFRAAAAMVNGFAYLIGGDNGGSTLATVDRIDLTASPPTVTPDDPLPSAARSLHVACAINDRIYVFMGKEASYVTTIKAFDPAQASGARWTVVAATTPQGLEQGTGDVVSGKAYLFGGLNNVATAGSTYTQAFDPSGPSTATKTAMTTLRYGACAVAAYGAIYVIGGSSDATGATALSTVEVYYPPLD